MRILDHESNYKTEMSDIVLWKMQYQDQCGGLSRTRSGNPRPMDLRLRLGLLGCNQWANPA